MKYQYFLYVTLLFLLISCTPQTEGSNELNNEEPVNEQPIEENEPEQPTANPEEESSDNESPEPEATPVIEQDESFDDGNSQKSEPAVVDLGSLMTPSPESGSEPVEQPAPGIPDGTAKLVQDVQIDLSEKLGVDMSKIETISVEEVVWRDSSLGCPVDGMAYLQVITSGFRILLEVDGQTYHYHSKDTSNFVLCENPQPPIPVEAPPPGLGDT